MCVFWKGTRYFITEDIANLLTAQGLLIQVALLVCC